jgi:hypothetical protein
VIGLEKMYLNSNGISRFQAVANKSTPVTDTTVQTTPQNPPNPNYGSTGILRLQAVLAKANLARQDNPASPSDNSGNIYISRDLLGYTIPMSAEDQIKLVDEYEKKKFTRDAIYGGISQIGAAISGANANYPSSVTFRVQQVVDKLKSSRRIKGFELIHSTN